MKREVYEWLDARLKESAGSLHPEKFSDVVEFLRKEMDEMKSEDKRSLALDWLSEFSINYDEDALIQALLTRAEFFPDPISFSALANHLSSKGGGLDEALGWSLKAIAAADAEGRLQRHALSERFRMLLERGRTAEAEEALGRLVALGPTPVGADDIALPQDVHRRAESSALKRNLVAQYGKMSGR